LEDLLHFICDDQTGELPAHLPSRRDAISTQIYAMHLCDALVNIIPTASATRLDSKEYFLSSCR
jgi:hypothetical protein